MFYLMILSGSQTNKESTREYDPDLDMIKRLKEMQKGENVT